MLLISESKKYDSAPAWWDKMTRNQQQAYLEKRKNSGLRDFLKGSDGAKTKKVEIKPVKTRKSKRVEPVELKTSDYMRESSKKESRIIKKAAREDVPVDRVFTEKLTRREVAIRADRQAPILRAQAASNLMKFNEKVSNTGDYYNSKVSPSGMRQLTGYLNAKRNREEGPEHAKGKNLAIKLASGTVMAALGLGALVAASTGALPIAGAIVGALFGMNSFKDALLDFVAPDPDEIEKDSMVSTSADRTAVNMLVDEVAVWLNNQDLDSIAYKIAEYNALDEMEQEGWKPNVSMLSDEELDQMSNQTGEEYEDNEEDEDTENEEDTDLDESALTSESSVTPRIGFSIGNKERTKYDVKFDGRVIGILKSLGNHSKNKRQWTLVLTDGFNETIFRSGKSETEPYTLVKGSNVVLVNPIKQTYPECCAWARRYIDKNFL